MLNANCARWSKLRWTIQIVLLILLAPAWPIVADEESRNQPDKVVVPEADATGEPESLRKATDGPTFYLWRTGDVWHIKTKSKNQKHEFRGKIKLEGGKVTKVSDFGNLEVGGKRKKAAKKPEDLGRVNPAKNEIDFKFITSSSEVGFAFTVDKNVKSVTFELTIDGNPKPDRIKIGTKSVHPKGTPFVLTMPEKDPPNESQNKPVAK